MTIHPGTCRCRGERSQDQRAVFIRFVVPIVDPRSRARLGVIHAAYELSYAGVVAKHDEDYLSETIVWFNKNLAVPKYYAGDRHPRAKARAICWFKPGAKAQIERARDLQHILEYYGAFVEMIKSRRRGYIVYEDAHQVTAIPFSDTAR
jgi:hypothetical protein